MQRKGLFSLINLIILIAGILLIATSRRAEAVHTIIWITGIAFLVPSVINIFLLSSGKEKENRPGVMSRAMGWITSVAGIILGAVMVIFPESFRALFIYVFAFTLFIGGVYHIYLMASGLRPAKFPLWAFIAPLLLILGGVALCFVGSLQNEGARTALIVTGIGLILFVLSSIIEGIIYKAQAHKAKKAAESTGASQSRPVPEERQIEDVNPADITEVK